MISYSFSTGFVLRWLGSAALRRRRDAGRDGDREFARYRPHPRAIGMQRIPAEGPFIVVMNHYERPGMRMWWPAWFVFTIVCRRRPDTAMRWLITDRFAGFRLLGVVVPVAATAWFLRLVARSYDLLLVNREEIGPRAPMLREAYRALHSEGRPLGITPEAGNAEGLSLEMTRAEPGSGGVIAWLSRGRVPVLPVGVYDDEEGRLSACFGEPFTLDRPRGNASEEPTERVMRSVAALLPPELRGVYGDAPAR